MGFLLAIVTAFFFPGVILRVKSRLSGRKGPGILQPWKNIAVLLRKDLVISTTTSFIFSLAPVIYLSTILCAILMLPFPGFPSLLGFEGDFVLFAYLLALGKFFFILAALDTGSSFEGMGASREALYSMLVEPAFFILFGTLALLTGHTSMEGIFDAFRFSGHNSFIIGFIGVYLLVQIAMIENSRMPVDDPKTHLELTMIHEVMILDHSGFDLALMHIGTSLKFAMYGLLVANFLIPSDMIFAAGLPLFLAIQVIFATMIGLMESFRARKKLARNPQFIVTLSSIALVAFILVLLIQFKMI
ncbi:MAG TPA: NADH-quinone oxidoreductase subunit H [Bacteroidales bacterium]|nr:NADH-quinone oxidoreductase subunit H [Bacteroidales bacterium]HPS49905.1 NADH-quinone oxidoreductase subunit H [Bacteroidales bacterium]